MGRYICDAWKAWGCVACTQRFPSEKQLRGHRKGCQKMKDLKDANRKRNKAIGYAKKREQEKIKKAIERGEELPASQPETAEEKKKKKEKKEKKKEKKEKKEKVKETKNEPKKKAKSGHQKKLEKARKEAEERGEEGEFDEERE